MEEKDPLEEERSRGRVLRDERACSCPERERADREADQLLLSGGSQWSRIYGRRAESEIIAAVSKRNNESLESSTRTEVRPIPGGLLLSNNTELKEPGGGSTAD